ncbi:unnamed protein product [Polarella glacialis]|uniref:Uncharacterized protein n=1 Tax=Polarella glacialis TaxID=89957 RepID=A0A813IWZ4_POLGL|nr:unnamed protein product [Polarella glacialis]CAE8664470.1 unnamed protein product [Polarella glacialis]
MKAVGNGSVSDVQRWWVLGLVSAMAVLQRAIWNDFGPIADEVQKEFGWHNNLMLLLQYWGPIGYLLTANAWAWSLDYGSIRTSAHAAAALVAAGSMLRCLWTQPGVWATVVINLGQFLNGLATPFMMTAGIVVSARWNFPTNERLLAMAVGVMSNYLGASIAFILGPYVIRPDTAFSLSVQQYMFCEACVAVLLLIVCVFFFPDPPEPPATDIDFPTAKKALDESIGWNHCSAAFGNLYGFWGGWGYLLWPNFGHMFGDHSDFFGDHVVTWYQTPDLGGKLAFGGGCAGMVVGVALAAFLIRPSAEILKNICLALQGPAIILVVPLGYIASTMPHQHQVILWACNILAGACFTAIFPLHYWLAQQAVPQVGAGVSSVFLARFHMKATLGFQALYLVCDNVPLPGLSAQWMNNPVLGTIALAVFAVISAQNIFNYPCPILSYQGILQNQA